METNVRLMVTLQKLYITLAKSTGQNLKELGLTGTEFLVLAHLNRNGKEKVQKLAETAMITSGTITYTIKKLERANMIAREQDLEDKRIFWVELTSKGQELYENIFNEHMDYMECLLGEFSESEKNEFIEMIKYFGKGISEKGEK